MPRIREVLEASEWAMASNEEEFDGFATGLLGDLEDQGLDLGVGELEREMLGLRMAINDRGDDGTESKELNEDDLDADKLEMLMHRVQAIKGESVPASFLFGEIDHFSFLDMGADLPEAERKRFAAKAIRDLMKDV